MNVPGKVQGRPQVPYVVAYRDGGGEFRPLKSRQEGPVFGKVGKDLAFGGSNSATKIMEMLYGELKGMGAQAFQ